MSKRTSDHKHESHSDHPEPFTDLPPRLFEDEMDDLSIPKESGPYLQYGGLNILLHTTTAPSFQNATIHGILKKTPKGKYRFSSSDDGNISILDLNPRLKPLLDYFSNCDIPLRLTLSSHSENRAFVNEIFIDHPSDGQWDPNALCRELDNEQTILKHVLVQLLTNQINPPQTTQTHHRTYSTEAELEFLFETCKSLYPPHLNEWIQTSFARYKSSRPEREEKKHILKALSYVLNIDWTIKVPHIPPLNRIKEMLDAEFYGLEIVKQRILEIAAQFRRCNDKFPQWGILLVGPAGVGKTTISRAIARILGLQLVQLDMNTIKDPESLYGSPRIYINAKAGLIVEKLYSARSASLAMLINELDKTKTTSDRGDPSDALLTLVDKLGFADVFLETTIPTDGIFFIATCNEPDKLSKPLLDRFLRIDIPPYTPSEKKVIMEQYITPKMLQANSLDPNTISFSPAAIDLLCSSYAVEPGVRDLGQYAEKFLSHFLLEAEKTGLQHITYNTDDIKALLGPKRSYDRHFASNPGMALSAFMHEGNVHIFPVEAVVIPGTGQFSTLNINSQTTKDFCHAAYLAVLRMAPILQTKDVTVFIPQHTPDTNVNYLGIATAIAISSAIGNQNLSLNSGFIGGCDLFGNTYCDSNDITPYINAFASHGINRLYVPLGASKLIYGSCPSGMQVIEGLNLSFIIELAARPSNLIDTHNLSDEAIDFNFDD